jgi:DNA invertase Pin-like site-specific DNA recombinase
MTTILTDVERQVRERLKELEPLVQEAEELKRVLASFDDARARPTRATGPRRGARPKTTGRRGRPAGSATGSRAAEALRLVAEQPGITVSELADTMGIGTTYLYRVMPSLERDGKVRKSGTGYKPA